MIQELQLQVQQQSKVSLFTINPPTDWPFNISYYGFDFWMMDKLDKPATWYHVVSVASLVHSQPSYSLTIR